MSSATSLDTPNQSATIEQPNVGLDAGIAIAHIYKRVCELTEQKDPAAVLANKDAVAKAKQAAKGGKGY